jgi:cyclopropane fatty-acyl-phospholipid synthase-like methyltransferase
MQDEAFAEYFLTALDSRNAFLAHGLAQQADLAEHRAILDIGGGTGIYSCALVRRHPHLRATVHEKPPVDRIAQRAIERRGLSDRVSVSSGDMLAEPLPTGFDVHLYSNVVHDYEAPTVRRLFEQSFAALPHGGQLLIHDAVLDRTGAAPRAVAEYSVLLMAFTSGRCHSIGELRSLLAGAGFTGITRVRTVVHRSLVIARKPGTFAGRSTEILG